MVLSNEVLLRSKIAQLQLEKAKQQRKTKAKNNSGVASSSASPASTAAEGLLPCSSPSPDNGDRNKRSSRDAPAANSKHQLANVEDAQSRPRVRKAVAAAAAAAACGGASGGGAAARAESEEDVMRRFEEQVIQFLGAITNPTGTIHCNAHARLHRNVSVHRQRRR